MRLALLFLIVSASPSIAEPCRGWRVEVTSPTDADRRAGNVATPHGSLHSNDGYGLDGDWVCVVTRDGERSVRGSFSVELVASNHELQRVVIANTLVIADRKSTRLNSSHIPLSR